MSPQGARFIAKAQKLLEEAEVMLDAGLMDAAGRNAYLAAFHAAQAYIFELEGRTYKTHNGVQSEFMRLTKDDVRIKHDFRLFLSQAYNLKAIADYETGPGSEVPPERATRAVAAGKSFVASIRDILNAQV